METVAQISHDFSYDNIAAAYRKVLDEVAPLRVIRLKDNYLISPKIEAIKKRRDRFLKKFKKTGSQDHLKKAKSFSNTLKKVVKKETRRVFQCKARSSNPKHFWQALNEKMGKYKDATIELLDDNGIKITDNLDVANLFADFFKKKVEDLSRDSVAAISLRRPIAPLEFSFSELDEAVKSLSNKKSFGIDQIPQNLFKDTAHLLMTPLLNMINAFSRSGLPSELKVARVVPLHKKESKLDVTNYRPISNLSIFSKVYEKCLLSRLNSELPNAEGDHQHGFRKSHSTETALLTIQGIIADALDSGQQGIIYSVDLSAAFDLLKPDKFLQLFKNKMTEGLLFAIMDFLTNRSFRVHVQDEISSDRSLDRGCVQGSILGPKLFALYVAELKAVLESDEVSLVSYADDTYVIIIPKDITRVTELTEATLTKHIKFLETLGMVVNDAKTELMWIGPKPLVKSLKVGNSMVQFSEKMKALGIMIDGNLNWDSQAAHVIAKSRKHLSAFRFLRKYLTEKQFLKAASANYYGSVYYAANVWYHQLKKCHKTKLISAHFRLLRTAKRDFLMELKRDDLTRLCKRATPDEWTNFITSSRVIKILRDEQPRKLCEKLVATYFDQRRKPGLGFFFDRSRIKKGRQSLENRLLLMRSITFEWTCNIKTLTNDRIRIEMKKAFFSYLNDTTLDKNDL